MLPKTFVKGFDTGRLKGLLALFFLALAVPTGVLIWQAYSQLKWEAFHQHRGLAEDLTERINADLIDMIRAADARSFADYSFLNVTGDTQFNFVQRSPLSAYPVTEDLPGIVGYFQVDSDGTFSTPLLPPAGAAAEKFGIGPAEYEDRLRLAREIQTVLADNRLVQSREDVRAGRDSVPAPAESVSGPEKRGAEQDELAAEEPRTVERRSRTGSEPATMAAPGFAVADDASADRDAADDAPAARQPTAAIAANYGQQAFDELRQSSTDSQRSAGNAGARSPGGGSGEIPAEEERPNIIGKLSDVRLDAELQKKSESVERAREEQSPQADRSYAPGRAKRREQIALPEAAAATDREVITNVASPTGLRISTFESEIDPLEFSLLDSGHFVLFRNVWREGQRYIQGLLVDRGAFLSSVIEEAFHDSPLSAMSNLIVGYQDDVISFFPGPAQNSYPDSASEMRGALLYSSRLTAPLDKLELIYSINRLPQGPGATVLGWVTLVLAAVFTGGFVMLYRLGLSQINVARQQQDFVSAVSHELKTPLTSIRMYGEMLREGWADENKRQDYYKFIHDESERLTRMIANVLQLAKITHNEPSFDMKPAHVGELMTDIQSKIATHAERGGFTLRFNRDAKADEAEIEIDEDCFAQIIINLVDNAIKFSRNAENKTIDIGSKLTADGQLQFSVRDHGPGIPKDQMKKIFRLFYRTESELTRETVGTGIGLAIVHQLTTAMNGKVDVVNAKPGAEFRISFPATESQEQQGLPRSE